MTLMEDHHHILMMFLKLLDYFKLAQTFKNQQPPPYQVKLSGKSAITSVVWVGPGLMATVAGEDVVRVWDLDKDNNFSLGGALDMINCLSYSKTKRMLAGW